MVNVNRKYVQRLITHEELGHSSIIMFLHYISNWSCENTVERLLFPTLSAVFQPFSFIQRTSDFQDVQERE